MNYQKIIQKILFAVVVFALVSCHTPSMLQTVASISTAEIQMSDVAIIAYQQPNSEVIINDANRHELPAKVRLTRSSQNLDLKILQNDLIIHNATLKPTRLRNPFWQGDFFTASIQHSNPETRYIYEKYILIDSLGNVHSYRRQQVFCNTFANAFFKKHQKGDFNFLLALPHASLFRMKIDETPRDFGGFHGIGLGMEYFYKNNKSVRLRGDVITNFILPFLPIPVPMFQNLCEAFNINLTDNFHFGRFQMGYGLNFARNSWIRLEHYDYSLRETVPEQRSANNMLGLALNTHYRFTNHFHLGLIYRPSFFELSNFNRMYEHTISLDLLWKVHL